MKKITKLQATSTIKKLGSIEIYLVPCKVNINNLWISPMYRNIESVDEFEQTISEYTYYNCNNYLGNYPAYYIND